MSSQADVVASANCSQNSIETSSSFTHEDINALLEANTTLQATDLIAAIRKLARGAMKTARNLHALERLCDRLLASVTSAPTLTAIVERLETIDAKISAPPEVTTLTYAAAAASAPIEAPPKRTRADEVAIKIDRHTDAERKAQGTGEEMKAWVEEAMRKSGVKELSKAEVAGVQPHRSGMKITVRFKCSKDADQMARCAVQCSAALGAGAKVSVPHYGVVIQDVPLYYDPSRESYRSDLHAQNPSLIPSPDTIVEARWLVPTDRLPPGRKTGSWVVFLDSQQAADNLIDQGVRVQALLLNARRYFSGPRQCRKCQQWGHLSYSCKARSPTCTHCSGQHTSSDCPNPETKKCTNCGGNHAAFHPQCETRRVESLRMQRLQASTSSYFAGHDFTFHPFPNSLE